MADLGMYDGDGEAGASRDTRLGPELYPALARLPMQTVMRRGDLARIAFTDGLAVAMVSAALLPMIAFKNDERTEGPRLRRLMRLIAARGYVPMAPIICRIGKKGKWVVVDGGHRLTALRRLREASWRQRLIDLAAWLGAPAGLLDWLRRRLLGAHAMVYFLLFTGPRSLSQVDGPVGAQSGSAQSGSAQSGSAQGGSGEDDDAD